MLDVGVVEVQGFNVFLVNSGILGGGVGCLRWEKGSRGYVVGQELGIDRVEEGGKEWGEKWL